MMDKGKYSSHGAMIKKLPANGMAKWQKAKLSVINPLPSTVPRYKFNEFKDKKEDMTVESKTMSAIFKFQEKIKQKPLEEQLIKPFLYIEKVMKRTRVQDKEYKNLKPFVASSSSKSRPASASIGHGKNESQIPAGYQSLYQYQQDKRKTASRLFKKLMDSDITNISNVYLIWNKRLNLKDNPQMNIKQTQFIEFMKQLGHKNITEKLIRHFFQLYRNREVQVVKKQKQSKEQVELGVGMISVKAMAYNYEKYLKGEVEISNIMSEKALKQRYQWVKRYLTLFDQNYAQLKQGMNSIRQYQQNLRQHFNQLYQSYTNPFQQQIQQLHQQLQKPIIKYDKHKKDLITTQITTLTNKHITHYNNITQQYQQFISNYQNTIVKNHDLFFNKRVICKLVLPVLNKTMWVNKEGLLKRVEEERERKRRYVECLSDVVVEVDKDKKVLGEDVFTLADLVEVVMGRVKGMGGSGGMGMGMGSVGMGMGMGSVGSGGNIKGNKFKMQSSTTTTTQQSNQEQQFTLKSVKKLIKQIKKQYLVKNQLYVEDIEQFPADQQIPLSLLHTCFQMQCTKVLAKNHIWTQLLNLIPQVKVQSKLHYQKMTVNQCLGYLKKYFIKLDQNATIQRNRSKQISLLIQNAQLDSLWYYNEIVQKVNQKLNNYNQDQQDIDQKQDQVNELSDQPKRVNFADVIESYVDKQNRKILNPNYQPQKEHQYSHEQSIVANDILKAIFGEHHEKAKKDKFATSLESFGTNSVIPGHKDIPESLQALKTLSKSFIIPQKDKKLSTNAFDIRFYEKMQQDEQQQQEILRMGTSTLLSHLPKPQQLNLPTNDPLKISRFLQGNISHLTLQQQKLLKDKLYSSNVKQGVDLNYFKDKIKLENRPTRYDSQGKSKYSVLFPVGYYEGILVNQEEKHDERWYLRPHHVETLTQNPLSKKDNVINTEYQSKLDKIPLKKRPQEFVIEENVQRKDMLIQSLQERIQSLKSNLERAQSTGSKQVEGQKVPNSILNKYLSGITEGKQDKDLEMATFQAVLYDLRRNERSLLVDFRGKRNQIQGEPEEKWWQKKDANFNQELRKDRLLVADSLKSGSPHKQYVEKLKNREIY